MFHCFGDLNAHVHPNSKFHSFPFASHFDFKGCSQNNDQILKHTVREVREVSI